jgi:hypothetical protein
VAVAVVVGVMLGLAVDAVGRAVALGLVAVCGVLAPGVQSYICVS